MDIINTFYNTNIQINKDVILDIANIGSNKKMLVFGLGYDSELWWNLTNKNTFFVEHDLKYINLNTNIDADHIIKYVYDLTSVKNSFTMSEDSINSIHPPQVLLDQAPFDIIVIDGPTGYTDACPGRLLPIFWSKKYLSAEGSIIYVDDSKRKLESYCIEKFFGPNVKQSFPLRNGCVKIFV